MTEDEDFKTFETPLEREQAASRSDARVLGRRAWRPSISWLSCRGSGCLEAVRARVAAQTRPARYLAIQLGTDAETVVRWLVALVVLLIDPSAVVLTIAASRR